MCAVHTSRSDKYPRVNDSRMQTENTCDEANENRHLASTNERGTLASFVSPPRNNDTCNSCECVDWDGQELRRCFFASQILDDGGQEETDSV
jgi:hypothetical protein